MLPSILRSAAVRAVFNTTVAIVVAAGCIGLAKEAGDEGQEHGKENNYTIGLFGDTPYNALGRSQYPNLLADLNGNHLAFSVFDGDLKAGGDGPCSDDLYLTAKANFNTLKAPLIFLPGDNDWTDCWGRYGASQMPFFDPEDRLDYERLLFASTDQSLGQKTLTLTRQTEEGYPENAQWKYGSVVYIGLNVQGSNDNFPYHDTELGTGVPVRSDAEIQRQRNEEIARKAANLRWLGEGFAYAKRVKAKGVLIAWQADPNFNNEQHLSNSHEYDAYADYVTTLTNETLGFPGQVALVHGDSHYFKMDKPLNRPSGGVLTNFTRVETFGARNTHWVSATIDTDNPNLFEFEPRIVPANTQ